MWHFVFMHIMNKTAIVAQQTATEKHLFKAESLHSVNKAQNKSACLMQFSPGSRQKTSQDG